MYVHKCIHVQTRPYVRTHVFKHTRVRTRSHVHTHTHTNTHTRGHRHTTVVFVIKDQTKSPLEKSVRTKFNLKSNKRKKNHSVVYVKVDGRRDPDFGFVLSVTKSQLCPDISVYEVFLYK